MRTVHWDSLLKEGIQGRLLATALSRLTFSGDTVNWLELVHATRPVRKY